MSGLSTLEKILFLKNIDLFSSLSPDSLSRLVHVSREVRYDPDEPLMMEGGHGDCLFVILQGSVSIRVGDAEIAQRSAGECIGEMSLIDFEPRSASVFPLTIGI